MVVRGGHLEVKTKVFRDIVRDIVVNDCTQDDFGTDYRYGFNGQVKDNELKGIGNSLDFNFRMYDSRLGKFLSLDPLTRKFPWLSPYSFAGNTPIMALDLEGLEPADANIWKKPGTRTKFSFNEVQSHQSTPITPVNKNGTGLATKSGILVNKIDVGDFSTGANYPSSSEASDYAEAQLTSVYLENALLTAFDMSASDMGETSGSEYAPLITKTSAPKTPNIVQSNTPNIFARAQARVSARIGGMRDRNSGYYEAYFFGSRNNGTNNDNSDLDLLIISNNRDFFKIGRGASIIESIKSDYKKSTGVDLDVNIMSPNEYNRNAAFKKSVDENKTKIKVR